MIHPPSIFRENFNSSYKPARDDTACSFVFLSDLSHDNGVALTSPLKWRSTFSAEHHICLARRTWRFGDARVVCRGRSPLDLYVFRNHMITLSDPSPLPKLDDTWRLLWRYRCHVAPLSVDDANNPRMRGRMLLLHRPLTFLNYLWAAY